MFGGEPEIRLKHHDGCGGDGRFNRKAYLRFDLSGLPATIASARLDLSVVFPQQGTGSPGPPAGTQRFRVWGLLDGTPGDATPGLGGWDEATVNWNNAPANIDLPIGFDAEAVFLTSFTLDSAGTIGQVVSAHSVDLASFVADDTNGLVTLMIDRETFIPGCSSWVHGFASKESLVGPAPTLIVELPPCNVADLAEPFGVLDLDDVDTFITAFLTQDPIADLAPPAGIVDLADIDAFLVGCP